MEDLCLLKIPGLKKKFRFIISFTCSLVLSKDQEMPTVVLIWSMFPMLHVSYRFLIFSQLYLRKGSLEHFLKNCFEVK